MNRPAGTVEIVRAESPMLRFASVEIEAALKEQGYRVRSRADDGTESSADHVILLDLYNRCHGKGTAPSQAPMEISDPGREGFGIRVQKQHGRQLVAVVGGDERGAMYKALQGTHLQQTGYNPRLGGLRGRGALRYRYSQTNGRYRTAGALSEAHP